MPVDFLSADQARPYGRFNTELSAEQLSQFFTLSPSERADAKRLRSDTNQLGYAVQLGTVRFLGTFLANCNESPDLVVRFVAAQLSVDFTAFKPYAAAKIRFDHAATIRERYGYVGFGTGAVHAAFLRWLWRRAWTTNEAPSRLLDHSTAWLVDHRVLLPGITTLTRLVATARERANRRGWQTLSRQFNETGQEQLDRLVSSTPFEESVTSNGSGDHHVHRTLKVDLDCCIAGTTDHRYPNRTGRAATQEVEHTSPGRANNDVLIRNTRCNRPPSASALSNSRRLSRLTVATWSFVAPLML